MSLNCNFLKELGGVGQGLQSKKTIRGGGMDIFWNHTFEEFMGKLTTIRKSNIFSEVTSITYAKLVLVRTV